MQAVDREVYWTVNGSLVVKDERIGIDNFSLSLSPLKTADSGTYTCNLTLTTSKPYITVQGPKQSSAVNIIVKSMSFYFCLILLFSALLP